MDSIVETTWLLVLQVALFTVIFFVAGRVWPTTKDRWGLADNLLSAVLYPVLTWFAFQGALETRHTVQSRWTDITPATHFFQVLYVSRSLSHCIIVIMQPAAFMHKVLTLAHHILSVAAYAASLLSGRAHHWAVLDGCCEITNIFLTNLFLFKEATIQGRAIWDMLPGWLYIGNGAMLWLTFVIFRLILFPYWLWAFFADMITSPELSLERLSLYELCLFPFANVFLFVLSTKWFLAIHQGLVKAACGHRQKEGSNPGERAKSS